MITLRVHYCYIRVRYCHTDRTFFVWRLNSARPSHPGHSIILLRSEIPRAYAQSLALWQQATIDFTCHDHSSRMLLLRSIVDIVSITRDYTPRSLFYCLFAPHICMVLLFTHIPFVVTHTINATPPERLQHYPDFQGFCPGFRQIKTFGGVLAPTAAPPPALLVGDLWCNQWHI